MSSEPLLDAWRDPATDVRIVVEAWCIREPVEGQFITRPRSPRMVWNYLLRVGPTAVWRKIRSRLAEDRRNRKIAGVGVGRVLEAPAGSAVSVGQRVVFFAPSHTERWPRLSLDARFVAPVQESNDASVGKRANVLPEALRELAGWSPFSGRALDAAAIDRTLRELAGVCAAAVHPASADAGPVRERRERHERSGSPSKKPRAVVFGLGNYAKTQIIPHVSRHLQIAAIHEIDPDQIASVAGMDVALDTSPWPRDHERFDAWFIAGFHHTHAQLALRALRDGAYAVVEKPIATTRPQFIELENAVRSASATRLFACFHKRYSPLNDWARADLGVAPGQPVDMHCIVYEIPLPALHWYNWPNSGSRLVSNGCHWLDYFLFTNDFSPVQERFVRRLRGGDLMLNVRLQNEAQLVMTLTDTGSERLGVRDVIELRARDVTVRTIDSTYYESESTVRVLRRRRVNPMRSYARMYDRIARRIELGESGDSLESLRSTALMLDLEDDLHAGPQRSDR